MTPTSRLSSLLCGALLLGAVGAATEARAQAPIPAVLPEVLFLIEESDAMNSAWTGDPSLTNPDTRWEYVRDAIQQVVQNSPIGMQFGVAMTGNLVGLEIGGFDPVAYPGIGNGNVVTALENHTFVGGNLVTWGQSYAGLLNNWAELPYNTPRSWLTGPFQYYCSSLIVITVGFSTGEGDLVVPAAYRQTPPSDFLCNDTVGFQGCYMDDVAYFANNSFSPPPTSGSGNVTTYSLLVDSLAADPNAQGLLTSTANAGGGFISTADTPGAMAPALQGFLSDAFSGEYSNAAVSMSPNGDLLLASFHEVQGGWPLYKGHLLAWNVDNDPNSTTYGEVVAPTITTEPWQQASSYGVQWDGGWVLSSRDENPNAVNQFPGGWNQVGYRNGFTEDAAMGMYSTLMPFDATEIGPGTDLTTLLIDEVPVSSNQACNPLPHDFDYDCDADADDAQLLVDFLRGADEAIFLGTALTRGSGGDDWKMGDSGYATAVVAPSQIQSIALEAHFRAYRQKLQSLPSVTYISSNAGQIHAFDMEGTITNYPSGGSELWFYMPRAKLDKDPDAGSKEFDGFQADDLFRSGQAYVNDGRLSLDHVWLDGYQTDLSGCSGPGYVSSQDDGVIDPNGCEWHRVLTWSGGFGSRHTYALDVTNPLNPMFLWERTDQGTLTYTGKGRSVGRPLVASFWDAGTATTQRRWIAVWGSGAQPPTGVPGAGLAHAGIYIADMENSIMAPTQYQTQGFSLSHPGAGVGDTDGDGFEEYPSTEQGLFGSPAGADLDGDGSIDVAYIGDSMGYMFKIAFDQANPNSPDTCLFSAPAASDQARHIYYEPSIFYGPAGELLVYWGTGSPYNIYDTTVGGIYAKFDPDPYNCTNPGSSSPQAQPSPCAASSSLFDSTGFYQFGSGGAIGEKISGAATVRAGRMFFATHIPGSDPCVLGSSRLYGLDVQSCAGGLFDDQTDSYSVTSNLYTEVPGLLSEPVFANGQLYALQIDGGPIDGNSPIDDFSVTPDNFTEFVYVSHRHVF